MSGVSCSIKAARCALSRNSNIWTALAASELDQQINWISQTLDEGDFWTGVGMLTNIADCRLILPGLAAARHRTSTRQPVGCRFLQAG